MWAECVLPSLFPFMVVALIFVKSGIADKVSLPLKRAAKRFNLPAAGGACFLLSVCSGYPAGSRVLSEYYAGGGLSRSDVKKLSYLCSTSGPLFIIGTVGFKTFGDKAIGLKILAAHILSVAAVSLIICLFSKKSDTTEHKRVRSNGNILYDCFYGAVVSVAVAGGFIAFFFAVSAIISDLSLLYPLQKLLNAFMDEGSASAVCSGLIEATKGCRELAAAGKSRLSVALAGFLITFGGASILLQQLSYLTKAGVKPLKFVSVKLLQAALCFLILIIIA